MAKIGTLVGQDFIIPTDNERKIFKQYVEDKIKIYFPFSKYELEENRSEISYTITVRNIFNEDKCYRMWKSGDVVSPRYMRFSLTKQKSYDEAEEGKFYEWESMGKGKDYKPELKYTDYSMTASVMGIHRRYRCKIVDGIVGLNDGESRFWSYGYGTEIDDIFTECSDMLERFAKSMQSSKSLKKNVFMR